ncbi:MAG: MlaE family lipid ABC transporter permease subunit [Thermodesulfovibrio sp.]|uniref:MlaE family ABC transporter permease n=1 Tax=unclassified Thermodesulfovibrio TaxID=2645936 RepID=UPI00083AB3D8|nr:MULTISPECIES: MlaE family lipid ABC transporter permease subunit [unclassified Thermodesulfovibrio]MDI1471397.1 MlaE family lipid ABC transporter permease subunit [Thermodesulfovibrio sp. 1176]MDI6714576.1 MlaE family lipid ABC transporter permease subunit [Thermodesulfovibrio sp.]
MRGIIRYIGRKTIDLWLFLGKMFIFLIESLYHIFTPPFKFRNFLRQVRFFGNKSIIVVIFTGGFSGMVLALQGYYALNKFGSEALLGPVVALSLIRELGPVLCALMVTGRAGSALTAEIGIMRITEQIDALTVMAVNPMKYVVVPNILAGLLTFPLLTAIFDVVGIYGGYLVSVHALGLSEGTYFSQMELYVDMEDIRIGFYKSLSFGLLVTWICTFMGYNSGYGARGVSRATTNAVVLSSVVILIWDYMLGAFLL